MKNIAKSWGVFVAAIVGVLVLFCCWPGIATVWASSIKESAETGATKEQFEIFSDVHASLGVLFTGFAFIGTYFLLKESRKQTKNGEEQLKCQRRQTEEELSRNQYRCYKDNIDNVHQFFTRIDKKFDKGEVCLNFSKAIVGISRNEETDSLERFFLDMKKQWHATCCLYHITMKIIMNDNSLNTDDKKRLLLLLHAPFSPLDEVAMAIFYHGAIDFDIFDYIRARENCLLPTNIWGQYARFEEYAKSRIKTIAESILNLDVQENEINKIFDNLSNILRTQNIYPTQEGNFAPW